MTSLRNTVMVYVTVLLLAVGLAAAATSYFFVKREVNSFQDNALQEIALTAGLIFRHDIQPHIDAQFEDQLVVQVWDLAAQPLHQSGPAVEIPYQKELGYSDVSAGGERWLADRVRCRWPNHRRLSEGRPCDPGGPRFTRPIATGHDGAVSACDV